MKRNHHAIVLDYKSINDGDRLYFLYTYEQGKITVPGRSVCKATSKNASHLEPFTHAFVTIAQNRGSGTIAGAIAEAQYPHIKNSYTSLHEAYRVQKIFSRIVGDQEASPEIFTLYKMYLTVLDAMTVQEAVAIQRSMVSDVFLWKVFGLLGYQFHVGRCGQCRGALEGARFGFDAHRGGVLCATCEKQQRSPVQISQDTIKILRLFSKNAFENARKIVVVERVAEELTRVTAHIARWIIR